MKTYLKIELSELRKVVSPKFEPEITKILKAADVAESYTFEELSDEAQEKVLTEFWDINVFYDWWEGTYEDASRVGIKINGFDIDRGSYCQIEFLNSAKEVAEKIISEHGEPCETYKDAQQFLDDYDALVKKYADESNPNQVSEENEYDFDNEIEDLESEFKKTLSEDYRILLQHEYEYLTSKEAIVETIIDKEYEYTKEGNRL